MRKIAVSLIVAAMAVAVPTAASAAGPRAEAHYTVVCDGIAYESVDAHAVELGGKAHAVDLFNEHLGEQCSLEGPFGS
jgi:hypothetical protein